MKALTILLAIVSLGLGAGRAAARSLGKELADLESHIKWSAVDGAWRNLRDNWVRTTAGCDEAACVAAQLLKLEQNVKWQAVDKAWRERRESWVDDCKRATRD